MYSSSKSPYATKITPRVEDGQASMTGLPINSRIMETLGLKSQREFTPRKGNY